MTATRSRAMSAYEGLMALLAVAVVPALLVEDRAADPMLRAGATVVTWTIWLAFTAEFVVGLVRARERARFVRESWFDLALIVISPPVVPQSLQGARALRALRVLRLIRATAVLSIGLREARRAFGRHKFHYVALLAIAIVLLGASGVYFFENGQNRTIASPADALLWAIVTATTVGYGDLSPVTIEGRVVAVILMITGIGVIGIFTATVASVFLHDQSADASIEARLDRIERKLDELGARVSSPVDPET
jgi:voltage-gated potassium channel